MVFEFIDLDLPFFSHNYDTNCWVLRCNLDKQNNNDIEDYSKKIKQ